MRRIAAALLAAMIAVCPASQGKAESLTSQTFADRVVDWEFGEQHFYATGRTRDRLITDSWGWWEVRDGALCMLWPPAEIWDCPETTVTGETLRLEFSDGRVQTGQFRE